MEDYLHRFVGTIRSMFSNCSVMIVFSPLTGETLCYDDNKSLHYLSKQSPSLFCSFFHRKWLVWPLSITTVGQIWWAKSKKYYEVGVADRSNTAATAWVTASSSVSSSQSAPCVTSINVSSLFIQRCLLLRKTEKTGTGPQGRRNFLCVASATRWEFCMWSITITNHNILVLNSAVKGASKKCQ